MLKTGGCVFAGDEDLEQGGRGRFGLFKAGGDRAAKVDERGGDGAKKDGELEPGEEGAFGGEVDFGFYADGDVDF